MQVLSALVRAVLSGLSAFQADPASPLAVEPGLCASLLLHLTKVPRFDMTAMCVPGRDREALKPLWDAAVSSGAALGEVQAALAAGGTDQEALRKKYRL